MDELPEVDKLFSQVPLPEDFELQPAATSIVSGEPSWTSETHQALTTANAQPSGQRFGPIMAECGISKQQEAAIPANTKKNTNWAMNVWKEWVNYCKQHSPDDYPPYLLTKQTAELNKWLSCFVLEVGRKDGNLYPPRVAHQRSDTMYSRTVFPGVRNSVVRLL